MRWLVASVVVSLSLAAGELRADDAARIDWARGIVSADGVGVADRHAPSPAVARGTSRRGAEDQARRAIASELARVPFAAGGKLTADQIDRVVATAYAIAAEPETDGAWRVTMAVPLEAVRLARSGPRALPVAGDAGPAVVVVDGATGKPAVGWKIGTLDAATLWVADVPAWAKDAPHVRAKSAKAGAIEIDRMIGTAATLFVIVKK